MKKHSILIVILVFVAFSFGNFVVQDGHDLFQKALAKERAEGNLEDAIALYQKVIEESKDKALSAKAQLRIGYCYEKLGLQEANKAFQLVIDNYPGQEQAVKEAREKLSILLRAQAVIKEEEKGITIRKLWSGRVGSSWGSPSPDGKYVAFYFDPQADLGIKDFATGEERRLYLTKPNQRGGIGGQICWSPDGEQIAYGWTNRASNTMGVRIVNFDGSNPRTIYQSKDWIAPYAWSPDGKYLLIYLMKKPKGKYHIGLLKVDDGSLREFSLDLLSWVNPTWIHWSPDGQSIIHTGFDRLYSAGFWRTDLNTGKMSMALRFDPIKQIWGSCISKDGKTIYDIKMDKKIQKSQLVAQNLETQKVDELYVSEWIHALDKSPDELLLAFFEGDWPSQISIKIISVDGGDPRTLYTFEKREWPGTIAWTPDGRNLLFSKSKEVEGKQPLESLWSISVDGGEPKELGLNMEISHLRIHPDGQHIAFHSGNRAEEIWVMENFLPKK